MFAGIVATVVLISLLYFFPLFRDTAVRGREKFRGDLMVTMGLMIVAGVSLIGLTFDELRKHRDSKTLLIFLWIIGTFVFASFINWAINARSLLPIAPAAGILIASRLEGKRVSRFGLLIPLLPAAVIAIAVVWADYAQANSARNVVKVIKSQLDSAPDKIFFEGHWGFQFYMEKAGYKPLNLEALNIYVGDFLVIPHNNTNIFMPPGNLVSPKRTFEFVPCPWLATMNGVCGAGFHSQIFGPVPFLFGKIPPEIYSVMEVKSLK